jgi:hypothetical protein
MDLLKQVLSFYDYYNSLYNHWRKHTFRLGSGWDTISVNLSGGMADVNITKAVSVWREPPYIPYIAQLLGWDIGKERDFGFINSSEFIKSLVKLYKTKGTTSGAEMLFGMIGIIPEIEELYRSFPLNGDFRIPNEQGISKYKNCLYDTKPFTEVKIPDYYKTGVGKNTLLKIINELGKADDYINGDVIYYESIEQDISSEPQIRNYLNCFSNNDGYRHPSHWYLNKSNRARIKLSLVRWQTITSDKADVIEQFVDFMKPIHIVFEDNNILLPKICEKPYDCVLGLEIKDSVNIGTVLKTRDSLKNELLRLDDFIVYMNRRDHLGAYDVQNKEDTTKYQEIRLNTCNSVVAEPGYYNFSKVDDKSFKFIIHNGTQFYVFNEPITSTAYYFRRIKIFNDFNSQFIILKGYRFNITIKDEDSNEYSLTILDTYKNNSYDISSLCSKLNDLAVENDMNGFLLILTKKGMK